MPGAYLDDLEGKITEDFWADRAPECQTEKERLLAELECHEPADDDYLEAGGKLLELSQRAEEFCLAQ